MSGEPEAQVEPIGVHPAHRGRDLGGALLAEMFRRMRAGGARTAHVEAYSDNGDALRLYEAAGFRPTRRILRYYRRVEP